MMKCINSFFEKTVLISFLFSITFIGNSEAQATKTRASMNAEDNSPKEIVETATLGTGCFWCTEAIFQSLEGVHTAVSGYSGGHLENPTYEQVCAKNTGHAEVVQITFDPQKISYTELLEVFWRVHNPTTLNQQGNDIGPQYRSAIFCHNESQKEIAETSFRKTDASDLWADPFVTEILAFSHFYKAENYHQEYFDRVGDKNPYCTYVVKPKVDKFKKAFKDKLKKKK